MLDDEIWNKRRDILLRHIGNVRENCFILGERLIERGEEDLGHQLIANGLVHDNSKFYGVEWLYLHGDVKEATPELFKAAAVQHVTTNPHHIEYWGKASETPRLFLAEMVADWKARSSEFGNDLWDWMKDQGLPKYKISTCGGVYKEIKFFTDLLLEPKFK